MEFNFLLGVKIIHLVYMTYLFKISNSVLGGGAIVTNLHSSLKAKDCERGAEWESDREGKRPVRRGEIILVTTREKRYVSEPIETKYYLKC
jgi:hypothetical protein